MYPETPNPYPKERRRMAQIIHVAGRVSEINVGPGKLTPNGYEVLRKRYLKKDENGNPTEAPNRMFHRVADNLAQAELNYMPLKDPNSHIIAEAEARFYHTMASLDMLPNSPTLMNAGRRLQQLSACFVLPVEDSLADIFESVKQSALIHKSGGGTGFDFSHLRPAGDMVYATSGVASGPVGFMKIFDAATEQVKQGGTRRGANMGILRVDHPDILTFIHAKLDGSLQNFNVSVGVEDSFMRAVQDGQEYEIINPHDGQAAGTLNAKMVWDLIAHTAWKCGDPGIVSLDAINRDHPNPHLGRIESTNPCAEIPELPNESCNLASINLARMVRVDKDMSVNWAKLEGTINTTVRMLDNIIDMSEFPVPEIAAMSRKTRRIGLGVMGFADMLSMLALPYDSPEARQFGSNLMSFIQQKTHKASMELADERGSYPECEASLYQTPMRNTSPTAIAPTGTISIIAGCSSGIEPIYDRQYTRTVLEGTTLMEGNWLYEAIQQNMHPKEQPDWADSFFKTAHEIAPEDHLMMLAAIQSRVDNGVSKTINMPHTARPIDVSKVYMDAWRMDCKAISVYRDGSKENQVLS